MDESDELIPVFTPSLAEVLGKAEFERDRPLTAKEVEQVRDNAACVMMRRSDASALTVTRGFRDVVPEDCWADWHRLRTQITGRGYLPKLVLCAVGDAAFAKRAQKMLYEEDIEHELRDADPRMPESFEAAAFRYDPSLSDEDRERITRHTHVIYALSPNFRAGDALAASGRMLEIGSRLLDECGADGLKCESSGIAHSKERWLELAAVVRSGSRGDAFASLVRAFVQFPIGDERSWWTCGMHLLGRPDAITAAADLGPDAADIDAAALFDSFCVYLIAECGDRRYFGSGHTFALDAESPRLRATWEACRDYAEDEFFFNPFGRLRFQRV